MPHSRRVEGLVEQRILLPLNHGVDWKPESGEDGACDLVVADVSRKNHNAVTACYGFSEFRKRCVPYIGDFYETLARHFAQADADEGFATEMLIRPFRDVVDPFFRSVRKSVSQVVGGYVFSDAQSTGEATQRLAEFARDGRAERAREPECAGKAGVLYAMAECYLSI